MFAAARAFYGKNLARIKTFYEHKFVRHGIRGVRVVFISFMLYSTGYNAGLLDYAQDPVAMDKQLMVGVLAGTNATGVLAPGCAESKRAHRIGSRIVASAISYASFQLSDIAARKEEYLFQLAELEYGRLPALQTPPRSPHGAPTDAADAVRRAIAAAGEAASASSSAGPAVSSLYPSKPLGSEEEVKAASASADPLPATTGQSKTALHRLVDDCDEEAEQWRQVQLKLRSAGSWSYLVTNSPDVNAFVTDLLPRRIFINKGLFDTVVPTDDELALVLGHEISHLILGHVPEGMKYEAFMLGFQLLLFSFVDPTGILSFLFDSVVTQLRGFMTAARSRECELEADSLGVIIAGRACFNVERGINVMSKLMHMQRGHQAAGAGVCTGSGVEAAEPARKAPEAVVEKLPPAAPRLPTGSAPAASTQWNDTHPPFESRIELLFEAHDRFADSKAHTSHCMDVESDLAKGFFHVMHKISDSVSHSIDASLDNPIHPGAIAAEADK
jgi:Zn-dependent protease with chaperone function